MKFLAKKEHDCICVAEKKSLLIKENGMGDKLEAGRLRLLQHSRKRSEEGLS